VVTFVVVPTFQGQLFYKGYLSDLLSPTSTGNKSGNMFQFQGDLGGFNLKRNGTVQTDYLSELGLVQLDTHTGASGAEDMAQAGRFEYPIEAFAPENGVFPTISLEITNLRKKNSHTEIVLPESTVRRVWADFAPYTGDHSYDQIVKDETRKGKHAINWRKVRSGIVIAAIIVPLVYLAGQGED